MSNFIILGTNKHIYPVYVFEKIEENIFKINILSTFREFDYYFDNKKDTEAPTTNIIFIDDLPDKIKENHWFDCDIVSDEMIYKIVKNET